MVTVAENTEVWMSDWFLSCECFDIQVLTSKSCSEEGLEDATNLLLQLSWANNATRQAVLKLLLEGARVLGLTVCSHIRWENRLDIFVQS